MGTQTDRCGLGVSIVACHAAARVQIQAPAHKKLPPYRISDMEGSDVEINSIEAGESPSHTMKL